MSNKEQIIIDGVDVSGCKSLDGWKHCNCCNDLIKTIYPKATKCHVEEDLRCETYPNCYYKQLARKTQECKELKSKNSILKNSLKPFQDEYFKNLETIVIAGLAKKSIRITAENTQLRKALEEIEKELKEDVYCESQECGCDDFEECLNCVKTQILDIISGFADGRRETSPDSEQIEHTVTEAQMRNSVSVEQIQDNKAKGEE